MKVQALQDCTASRCYALPAAGLGSAAGAVLAILERKPLRPYMFGTGASAAICLGLFGGPTSPKLHIPGVFNA